MTDKISQNAKCCYAAVLSGTDEIEILAELTNRLKSLLALNCTWFFIVRGIRRTLNALGAGQLSSTR
jgi:hypothetical protein